MDNKNKMLVDATHPEETRVVVLRNGRVEEFDYESANRKLLRGNIYLAKVTRVEPSLQAAFVEYGGNRHGFLAFSEIHPDYYQIPVADRRALIEAEELERASQEDDDEDEVVENGAERRGRSRRRRRGGRSSSRRRNDNERAESPATEQDPADGEQAARPAALVTPADPAVSEQPPTDELHFPQVGIIDPPTPEFSATQAETDAEVKPASDLSHGDAISSGEAEAPPEAGVRDDHVAEAHPSRGDEERQETEVAEGAEDQVRDAASAAERDEPDLEVDALRHDEGTDLDDDDSEDEDDEDDDVEPVEQVGSEDALEELPVRRPRRLRSYKIQEVIKRRQVILVQVVKEERGSKGAALTTYLSLAGRYTVLMPNTGRGGGISRKITNASDRRRLKQIATDLDVPDGMGLIIRTAGASRSDQEIRRDYDYLLRLWENIRELTLASTAPSLVYEEGNLIKRSIRDHYSKDVDEIIVAGGKAHVEAQDFMRMLMPGHAKNVTLYEGRAPLFNRYHVERQLNAMFSPLVTLRSGGYIVINQTEALVAVDVNSGKATREYSIEETALNTNLEAAEEIARQLKLRDLAGLIVIDFIDMEEKRNNRAVERRMKDCLREDRARIQVGRISHFGLLEMSRQRMRTGVLEGSTTQCPHCLGTGIIRSTESVALAVLRGLEDECVKGDPVNLTAVTTAEVALYILNNKRAYIADMEARYGVSISVEVGERMQGANFAIERSAQSSAQSRAPSRTAINMESGFIDSETETAVDNGDADGEPDDREGGRRSRGRSRRKRGRSSRSEARVDTDSLDEEDVSEAEADGDEAEPAVSREPEREDEDRRADEAGSDEDEQTEPKKRRRRRRGRRGGQRNRDAARGADDELLPDDGNEADDQEDDDRISPRSEIGQEVMQAGADAEASDSSNDPVDSGAEGRGMPTSSHRVEERASPKEEARPRLVDQIMETPPLADTPKAIKGSGESRANGTDDHSVDEPQAATATESSDSGDTASPKEDAEPEAPPRSARRGWWQRRLLGGD